MIPCACGDPNCSKGLFFSRNGDGAHLFINLDATTDRLIYLDANSLVKLISEARKVLAQLAEVQE